MDPSITWSSFSCNNPAIPHSSIQKQDLEEFFGIAQNNKVQELCRVHSKAAWNHEWWEHVHYQFRCTRRQDSAPSILPLQIRRQQRAGDTETKKVNEEIFKALLENARWERRQWIWGDPGTRNSVTRNRALTRRSRRIPGGGSIRRCTCPRHVTFQSRMRGRLVVITEGLSHLRAKVLSVPFHSTNIFSHHFSSLQQLSVIQACNISCIPGVSRNLHTIQAYIISGI